MASRDDWPGRPRIRADAIGIDAHRAFDASLPPIHRALARHLAAARSFRDTAVHSYVGQLKADDSIICLLDDLFESIHRAGFYPLITSAAQGACGALIIGYPPVGAPEHQDLHELLKDRRVRYPTTVTAKRTICLSLWQQGGELLPNRFDDVWLDQWLVKQASKSASVELVVQVRYVTLHRP